MNEQNLNQNPDGDETEEVTAPAKNRHPFILAAVIAAVLVAMVGIGIFLSDQGVFDAETVGEMLGEPVVGTEPQPVIGFDLTECTPDKRTLENDTWTLRDCAKPIVDGASE
jgi:hypothetical protein